MTTLTFDKGAALVDIAEYRNLKIKLLDDIKNHEVFVKELDI